MASLQWSFIDTLFWSWQGESSGFLWFTASELYLFVHKIPKWSDINASFLPLSSPRGLCAKKRLGVGWQVISWFAAVPDLLSYQPPPRWALFLLEWEQAYSCFLFLCYGFKPARCWTLIPAEAINEFWLLSYDWAMMWHLDLLHAGSVNPFWTLICSRWLWPMNKVYFYSSISSKGSRMLSCTYLKDVPESDEEHLCSLSI